MPLVVPSIDPRNYSDILRDALARIPVHNPAWTNFNDSDPGVTLIQLFAFMTESILYRANQIPERNRLKFLSLLGIPLRPATPARGFVTLSNERGPLEARALPAGIDLRAGQVRYRTTQGLAVLPIEAQVFSKQELPEPATDADRARAELYSQLYADLLEDRASVPVFYNAVPMTPAEVGGELPEVDLGATVDGCVWIALLARRAEERDAVREKLAGQTLTVGIMPRLEDEGIAVEQGQLSRGESRLPVHWEIANPPADGSANYTALTARAEGSPLTAPALVELTLPTEYPITTWSWNTLEPGLEGTGEYPPSLADTNIVDRVITWIRLRTVKDPRVRARLSWVGINATMVQQQVIVEGELVGTGTGEPNQCVSLANQSILSGTLVLTVGDETWHRVDDLLAADAEVQVADPRRPLYRSEASLAGNAQPRTQVYTLDPEAGEICFGDGAHGMRPRLGHRIVARYAFGGGRQGNVAIGAVNRAPQLPASYKVNNPLPTWGGDDAEDVATAEQTIPRTMQHRDRLVSAQDFKDIVRRTPGVDLGRVEVLPLYDPNHPELGDVPGVVTVMVIPHSAALNAPRPNQFFLEAVCDYLLPRRLVTTELHVRGPVYVDVWFSIAIEILNGYAAGPVKEAVRQAVVRFLSPLVGGHRGTGWPLDVPILPQEIEARVARVDGVRLVQTVLLGTAQEDEMPSVPMTGLQLPRLAGLAVAEDTPIALDQLRHAPPATDTLDEGQRWLPIPVLPRGC